MQFHRILLFFGRFSCLSRSVVLLVALCRLYRVGRVALVKMKVGSSTYYATDSG